MWWVKNNTAPPLITAGPPASQGIIGLGAVTAFGGPGQDLFQPFRSGFRIGGGYWFDCRECWGVDASFFILPQVTREFSAFSSGMPVLARPFLDASGTLSPFGANGSFSEVNARPAPMALVGAKEVRTTSELWGADVNLRRNLYSGCYARLDFLAGFAYLNLNESLTVRELTTAAPDNTDPVRALYITDSFGTKNSFYGSQVGLTGELRRGRWFVNGTGKVALGITHETIDINGAALGVVTPGVVQSQPSGLLALDSNSGRHERDKFAVMPQATLNVGYQLTERLRVYTGYDFLYLSNVVRPGDQIDPTLDPRRIPFFGAAGVPTIGRPAVPFKGTDFWAQGIHFGLEFNW
jgi:hypothetical protein